VGAAAHVFDGEGRQGMAGIKPFFRKMMTIYDVPLQK